MFGERAVSTFAAFLTLWLHAMPLARVFAAGCAAQRRARRGTLSSQRHLSCILVTPLCWYHSWCLFSRRKMEEWPDDGDSKELRLEVKAGEELFLEHLIRFCYSKQVTLTEGHPWVHFALNVFPCAYWCFI